VYDKVNTYTCQFDSLTATLSEVEMNSTISSPVESHHFLLYFKVTALQNAKEVRKVKPKRCYFMRSLKKNSDIASYGALGRVPQVPGPQVPTISFLIHLGVNLRANYPSIV